jgi:16S rRNA processing protein RimM
VDERDGRPDVVIGRIVRPQGNRGEVVVESLTDFGDTRFQPGTRVRVARGTEETSLAIVSSRPHGPRWVVGFEGVASIDDAEALRGGELRIADDDLVALPDGQYYLHDLFGCRVETTGGEMVGQVVRVDDGGGAAVLLVVETTGGEVLVPFADTICRAVDVTGRRLVIEAPEGLLELNRTKASGS